MPRYFKYPNKRIWKRAGNGRFAKVTAKDLGIGGVCPTCDHLLVHHYDGDPREPHLNPFKFRFRCFTCEPRTEAELVLEAEIEASKPKEKTLADILNELAANTKKEE